MGGADCRPRLGPTAPPAGALPLGPQLPVDRLLQVRGREGAGEPPPVHEEGRGRVDAERGRLVYVRIDGVLRLLAVDALLEPGDVEAGVPGDVARPVLQVLPGDVALLREEPVVHRPKLVVALLEGALG